MHPLFLPLHQFAIYFKFRCFHVDVTSFFLGWRLDGAITNGDVGAGVIIHPAFVNVVVATEHKTEGEALINADGCAGPDVPATDGPVVIDEPDVPFDTAWGRTACGKVSPDAGGTVDGIVCDTHVDGTSITDVTSDTVVAGGTVDGIFCGIDVVAADVTAVTSGTISGNETFVGHITCRGGEPHWWGGDLHGP